jgi:hypothetical protein
VSAFTRLRPNFALQQNFVMCHERTSYAMITSRRTWLLGGAPRPMKMGTIASPWRYDAGACHALLSVVLRRPAIFALCLAGDNFLL